MDCHIIILSMVRFLYNLSVIAINEAAPWNTEFYLFLIPVNLMEKSLENSVDSLYMYTV